MDERDEHPATRFRRTHDAREDAAALQGQSRQARRQAAKVHAETNAILDTVAEMMTCALRARGFALRAPVTARFRRDRTRSTGVEVVVRLREPQHADAAKAFLVERFPDPLSEMIVR